MTPKNEDAEAQEQVCPMCCKPVFAEGQKQQLAEARALISRLRCAGGNLAMNLHDAAVFNPEQFNVAGVQELIDKWNALVGEAVALEMGAAQTPPASQDGVETERKEKAQ